jgi:hypothetical protein
MRLLIPLPALTIYLLAGTCSYGQAAVGHGVRQVKVKVVDLDRPELAVRSKIVLVGVEGGTLKFLALTNSSGEAAVNCTPTDLLEAIPIANRDYYLSNPAVPCSPAAILHCQSHWVLTVLTKAAQTAAMNRSYGKAALVNNELAVRQASVQLTDAAASKQRVYEQAADVLKVDDATVFDPQQGRQVMSPDLKAAVLAFQEKSDIPTSGQLDYKTLQKMSGVNVGTILASGSIN